MPRKLCLIVSFFALIVTFKVYAEINSPNATRQSGVLSNKTATVLDQKKQLTEHKTSENYGKIPLHFEPNRGQISSPSRFFARGSEYGIFLKPREIVLSLEHKTNEITQNIKFKDKTDRKPSKKTERSMIRMRLVGATANAKIEGEDELAGKVNYLRGNDPSLWHTDIPTFSKVRYKNIYEGIDLIYYGNQSNLEYDFVVAPGANANRIKLKFKGVSRLKINSTGDLLIQVKGGEINFHKPFIYQTNESGARREITGGYRVDNKRQVSFIIGRYDKNKPLIIDPVLSYSTYLGGISSDLGYDIAVDQSGCAYITGETNSRDFPTSPGGGQPTSGASDVFVTKLNPEGTGIVYSTVFGGGSSQNDIGRSIAVDSSGQVYVVGTAMSQSFPNVNNFNSSASFRTNANPPGTWTNVNTGPNSTIHSLAIDTATPSTMYAGTEAGIYKSVNSGATWTSANNGLSGGLQTVSSLAIKPSDSLTLFAATYNSIGTMLYKSVNGGVSWTQINSGAGSIINTIVFDPVSPSTLYLGAGTGVFKSTNEGETWTQVFAGIGVNAVLIDPGTTSTIYIATASSGVFKSVNGGGNWSPASNGLGNVMVRAIVFDPNNSSTLYAGIQGKMYKSTDSAANWTLLSTNLGGETPITIIVNPTNTSILYVLLNALGVYRSVNGGVNWVSMNEGLPGSFPVVIVKALVKHPASETLYAGLPGGVGGGGFVTKLNSSGNGFIYSSRFGGSDTVPNSVVVDSNGSACVTGTTRGALPQVNAIQPVRGASDDAFILKLTPEGDNLAFSTYYGGIGDDRGHDVAIDTSNNIYVTGNTSSPDFLTVNPLQPNLRFTIDSFVIKMPPTGTSVTYSTFIGGSSNESGYGIAADSSGNAYVTGYTSSSDFPQANTSPIQPVFKGDQDAFVTKINSNGSAIVYSTYLGGSAKDIAWDIAVDSSGNAYVNGQSNSLEFPAVRSVKSNGGFFKSSHTEIGWRNDVLGFGSPTVFTIVVDPVVPSTIYAGTADGIFKSIDYGETWILRGNGLTGLFIYAIAIDPSDTQVLYAAATLPSGTGNNGGIYKSINGGENWFAANNGIPPQQQISGYTVYIDPTNPSTIYAGVGGLGPIYRSLNKGGSWTPISLQTMDNPTAVLAASSIAVNPQNPNIIYAVSRGSFSRPVYRTINGGTTWTQIPQGIPTTSNNGYSLVISPSNLSTLYVCMNNGLFKSTNGGDTWTQSLLSGGGQCSVNLDPVNPSTVYFTNTVGLFRSTDGGATWDATNYALSNRVMLDVAVNPANSAILYSGSTQIPNPTGTMDSDAFLTKIDPTGSSLPYSVLLGSLSGNNGVFTEYASDVAFGVAIDEMGGAYLTGWTQARAFPITPGAYYTNYTGNTDVFVSKLNSSKRIKGLVSTQVGTPIDLATINLSGAQTQTATTGADGEYVFPRVIEGGNLTITPSKVGYSFVPSSQTISNLGEDQNVNFTAMPENVTISGQVTNGQIGLAGVTITLSGSQSQIVNTDSNGNYSFIALYNGSYTVTPSLADHIFAPQSQTFSNLTANQTANFSAATGYFINGQVKNGNVGISNVTIRLEGSQTANTITDNNGNYAFAAAAGGNYTVTPISSFYTFTPANFSFTNLNATQTANFNASRILASNGRIAYAKHTSSQYEIFTSSSGGGDEVRLTNNQFDDTSPKFSANGRMITFVSMRDGNPEIYVMDKDGNNQTRLTNDFAADIQPVWSPGGSKIAFTKKPQGNSSMEIYIMNSDGSDSVGITNNVFPDYAPAWSPDGSKLAFVSERDGNAEIYVMNTDGTNILRLTNNNIEDNWPAWSPDGMKIAFTNGKASYPSPFSSVQEIYIMNGDGTNQIRLTNNTRDDSTPAWSPDGTKIAFAIFSAGTFDIVTMNADGTGQTVITSQSNFEIDPSWQPLVTSKTPFDFDGDGKSDISIFRPSNAEWWINRSSDGNTNAYQFGSPTDKPVPADYDGDGITDVAFWRPSTGEWFVLRSSDLTFFAAPFGNATDIPAPGDFDGDNKADLAVFRPSQGTWFINKTTGGVQITQFGINGDQPVVSDYDGDGKADIAIFRPMGGSGSGEWWMNRSTAGLFATPFGSSTDKTVPGDYTGDGKADIAFWRPSTGEWYVLRSENLTFYSAPFGANGDIPAPGDYDGDGKFDFAVFRPSNATWYILRSTQGALILGFGTNGDLPTAASYVR